MEHKEKQELQAIENVKKTINIHRDEMQKLAGEIDDISLFSTRGLQKKPNFKTNKSLQKL